MQWSGVITSGVLGDCNGNDGCNYPGVIAGSSFTTGHVYCAIGQDPYWASPNPPIFHIYYGTIANPESLTSLGTCQPTQRYGAGSYFGTGTLTAQALSPGSLLAIAPSGYTNSGGVTGQGMVGFPVTVTIAP